MEFTDEQKAQIEAEKQEAIKLALEEQQKKHQADMANARIKADEEKKKAVEKAVASAKLSEEERVKKELEERQKADQEELAKLRLEKKLNERKEKLVEAGVPEMFKNDSRLINAEDDKVDEVIKTISEEWKKLVPQGATTSTNVKNSSGKTTPTDDEFKDFRGQGFGK